MVDVQLIGMNIPVEMIDSYWELYQAVQKGEEDISKLRELATKIPSYYPTPEPLCAAGARTSRKETTIPEILHEAIWDIDSARKSNEGIVYGMGHATPAEHAYFNFSLGGVSRALVDWIEKHRLASYTEKSMRYVQFKSDYVFPAEITDDKYKVIFNDHMKDCFELYQQTYDLIFELVKEKNPELVKKLESGDKKEAKEARDKLSGMAKEDARYCVPYATKTQVFLSPNARELEYMLRNWNSLGLEEAKQLAKGILEVKKHVPSLLKYTDAERYYSETPNKFEQYVAELAESISLNNNLRRSPVIYTEKNGVKLTKYESKGDEDLVISLLTSKSDKSRAFWEQNVEGMSLEKRAEIVKKSLLNISAHDSLPRAFEDIYLSFEAEISEACYAQLKRHRPMTLIKQSDQPSSDIVVPKNVIDVGNEEVFYAVQENATETFFKIAKEYGRDVATYVLPLQNKVRVEATLNLRELHWLARHREDAHAQWEVKELANNVCDLAREIYPLGTMLLCGKDKFKEVYNKLFSE